MKKRGFTLIELLAVIVVLAIIALIATPIVMNVIKNASKGAAERSAERYIDAVETAIATDRLENDLIADGTYNIVDGQLEGTTLTIEVSGDYPKCGTIGIAKGQVVSDGTSMTIGNYTVTVDTKGKATAEEKPEVVKDAEYYGISYYVDQAWGESNKTTFFYVDESKAPEGYYEQANVSDWDVNQFVNTYEDYLLEISNFIYSNYDELYSWGNEEKFMFEFSKRAGANTCGRFISVSKDSSGNINFSSGSYC